MVIFVDQSGLREIQELLQEENIPFEVSPLGSGDVGVGGWATYKVEAQVPEVAVPLEMRDGEIGGRAFRLPSGKLIFTDLEGNLDRISVPPPSRK